MPSFPGIASQTRASISRFRLFAAPTFSPVCVNRVHRVYSDTADSLVTPPNSHAPSFLQSAHDHVLITRCLPSHWLAAATPLFLIGKMLPPAILQWILFLFFSDFLFFHVSPLDSLSWGWTVPLKVVTLMSSGRTERSRRAHSLSPFVDFWHIKSVFPHMLTFTPSPVSVSCRVSRLGLLYWKCAFSILFAYVWRWAASLLFWLGDWTAVRDIQLACLEHYLNV